ncbi:fatty acid desaturase [Legionella sp. W05-934-2]|jgi:stearoyl-CoA desaturase (delta-9 desaturase)|uniref:fatty acid desaturase n=1 Tax=Legionella sp. W05-934-2 TaxID=1198649 RepID=UPI0034619BA3
MKPTQHKEKTTLNWVTTLFLTINPMVAIIGTIVLGYYHAITWPTIVLGLVYGIATGLSITCGYHRLFSHRAYQAKLPVRVFFALFGAAAFEGSVLEWCTDHRNHHKYTDTDKDPYNAKRGFWYSHIGWLFTLNPKKRDFSNVKELQADPFLRFQDRYYIPVAIVMGYFVPMLIAGLWGDVLGGLIIASALRIALNQHITFCVNSVCHIFGKQTYSDHVTAVDNWFTAFFTYGEGFHNFHHKFPLDYRNGIRAYHFDPSKWVIKTLYYLGLASNLRMVSTKRIVESRLRMDELRLNAKAKTGNLANLLPMLTRTKESVLNSLGKLEELERAYSNLKDKKDEFIREQKALYRRKKQEIKQTIKQARRDLKRSLSIWSIALKRSLRTV